MDAIVELGKLRIADPNRSQRSAIEIIRHKYPRVPLGALLEGWEVQSEAANAATGGDGLRTAFQTSAPLAGDMPMGTNVVVKGLVGRADLNGMTARVVGAATGTRPTRYPITMKKTGETVSIKVSNLSMFGFPPPPWTTGMWCPVAGTGLGSVPSSPEKMMHDFSRGQWGKPPLPSDLGVPVPSSPLQGLDQAACPFDCLENDLLLQILGRVPRMSHSAMACVSKLWRATVRNQAFVLTRRRCGFSEPFIVAVAGEDDDRTTHNHVSLLHGDKWLKLAALPHPTGQHCAVVCEEEIYVLGGHHCSQTSGMMMMIREPEPCACVMVFSPWRNAWRATCTLNKVRSMPGIAECDGAVFVFGGMDSSLKHGRMPANFKDMTHCERYQTSTTRWDELVAPMPFKCNSARAVTMGTSIYVMGGCVDCADDPHKHGVVQVYDTKANAWSLLEEEMPIAGGQCFADGVHILVLGGCTSGRRPQAKVGSMDELARKGKLDGRDRKGRVLPMHKDGCPKLCELELVFDFDAPTTAEAWCLDTTTGIWTALATAPKPHSGYFLYRDGEYIRAADDPSLNYHIPSNEWRDDPTRPKLTGHLWSAEILCAPLPF